MKIKPTKHTLHSYYTNVKWRLSRD